MDLACYQPDIPQNVGALIRLCAGLGAPLHLIEPFGFIWDERKIRTSAMDYRDIAPLTRHTDWAAFQAQTAPRRIILLTTKGATDYRDIIYRPDDILLLGRESAGVPDEIHSQIPDRALIPLRPPARSLNVVTAAAIVLGEGLRQTEHCRP